MLSSSSFSAHNSLMFELDDEETLPTATPNAHEFLNFSRRITERSLKKPVDAQVGIAYGKDLLFSQHQHRIRPLKNAVRLSPFLGDSSNLSADTAIPTQTHLYKPIATVVDSDHLQSKSAAHLSASQQQPSVRKGNSLDKLVADVLNYIDSCPDHSAYSYDLAKLKPKLEALSNGIL